jgi:hypothetical protein
MNIFFLFSVIIFLSFFTIWQRYLKGFLLTPVTGVHFQILVFFGFGGISFCLFPDAEPRLSFDEIVENSVIYMRPFLVGYVISCLSEYLYLKYHPTILAAYSFEYSFNSVSLFPVALIGFSGCLLEGRITIVGLSTIATYLKCLFFPALVFMLTNHARFNGSGKFFAILCYTMAIIIGIWSPWKSVLIVLLMSIMLAVAVVKPRLVPYALSLAIALMMFLVPFQNMKRSDYQRFTSDPLTIVRESLELNSLERLELVGSFFVLRINYVRELVYVNLALDSGMSLTHGSSYKSLVYQIIPRVIWPSKPAFANWAGFDLPREVGLLQAADQSTSWAVNLFAEACYNFGKQCLIWFIPLIFLLCHGLDRFTRKLFKARQTIALCSATLFFVTMSTTNVIFLFSTIFAIFGISWIYDVISRPPRTIV